MLKKLFGGKKSNYYLELKEDSNGQAAPTAPSPSTDSAPAPKAETAKAESTAAPKAEAAKASAKSAKKAAKVDSAPAKVEPAPAPTNGKVEPTAEATFATNYLNTTTSFTTRRRPGANMSSYLNLARQVKKPNA